MRRFESSQPSGQTGQRRTIVKRSGFTLVELMFVVSVIAIIMAMAIPALVRARMGANEGSAVSSIKAIITANQNYETRFDSYAGNLDDLGSLGMIDEVLASADALPGKSGYLVTYSSTQTTFQINADPVNPGSSGLRRFFADHTGVDSLHRGRTGDQRRFADRLTRTPRQS